MMRLMCYIPTIILTSAERGFGSSQLVSVEVLSNLSIEDADVDWVMETVEEPISWMNPIKGYLLKETLPEEFKKRRKILRKAPMYLIQDGRLYR